MKAGRRATPEVTPLEGRALLSAIGSAAREGPVVIAEVITFPLDGSLRGRIINGSGSNVVIGHGQLRSIGKVSFVATFNESIGLDTISLTDGVIRLKNHRVNLTLSVSPTTAVVPRNQFRAHFAVTSGSTGSGTFEITTFSDTRFIAKLHSGG
jgi:hypothetical protein